MNQPYLIHTARILALTALLGVSAPGHAADALAVGYYEDAVSRFASGDMPGALVQLKNSLQRDPTRLSAKILLGRTYLASGRPREAEEELLQAQQLGADPFLTALPLARARNELGQYKKNIADIVPTGLPVPRQPDLWVELGIARLGNKDPEGARIAFTQALAIDPLHPGGRIGLARIPLQRHEFAAAEQIVDGVLAGTPDHAEAWFIKASAAHALGRFTEAAEAYARARELDPQHLQAAVGEAGARIEAGDAEVALGLLAPLRKRYPHLATIPYLQSEALDLLGRTEAADEARSAAGNVIGGYAASDLSQRPEDLLLFGTIAFDSGRMETAYGFLSALVNIQSGNVQARKMLGKTLLSLGKPAEAQRVLSRISANEQADAESLALLGDAHVQIGDYEAAARYYREALANHNGGPAIVRRLGMTQFHSGRREQALDTLQMLVDRMDGAGKADTALLLGMLYLTENRLNEARGLADRLVADDPQNLTARNLQAVIAITRGDTDHGRRILKSILDRDATFRPARYNLIKLDIAEGNDGAASTALRRLLADDPDDVRALLESARFAQSRGDRRIAAVHLEKIRELEPKNVLAITELINLYLAGGDIPLALARATALERVLPNEFLAQEALARTQLASGDKADAAITLEQLSRLAGDDTARLLHTARLQVLAGALEDAVYALTKALALEPDNRPVRLELAKTLFRKGDHADAEHEITRVLEASPRDLPALSLLGDIRLAQRRTEEAVTLYRRARAVADTPQLTLSLNRALLQAGQPDAALELLKTWHAAHPGTPAVMRALAAQLFAAGELQRSLQLHQALVEATPDDAFAWNNLAIVLADRDAERALQAAMKAQALAPDNATVLDTLGWTLVQLGELDKGLAHLREALSRNGRSATIRYHLAVALHEYGNPGGARLELEQALSLSPSFPEREAAEARLASLRAQQ